MGICYMVIMKNVQIKSPYEGLLARGRVTIRQYRAGTKELLREIVQDNLIMQGSGTGKDLFIQRLIGVVTYTATINYGCIGTGSAAPAASDTQLAAEVARVVWSTASESGYNQATFQFFFPDANLANGTYNEFGMVVDGTASANTGRLFNRALFATPYAKVAGTDTTVQVDITLT